MQLGAHLNRLIKERAYLTGSLEVARERLTVIEKEVTALKEALTVGDARREILDQRILALSQIPLDDIRPIRAIPRISKAPHGKVIAGVIQFFQQSAGRSIRSDELQRLVASLSGCRIGIEVTKRQLKFRVANICFRLKQRGVLERLDSSKNSDTGGTHSVWRWIGPAPQSDAQSGERSLGFPPKTEPTVVEPINGYP